MAADTDMAKDTPSDQAPIRLDWLRDPALGAVLKALDAASGKARIVGGAVRNSLLNLPVKDIDIATVWTPEQVEKRLRTAGLKAIPTGKSHGTITAVSDGRPFEITTLRVDVSGDGRHAEVAFTDDWEGDAARRDFTINAIYADADGRLHDPFDGRVDLAAGRVRFIGDAGKRVREDYLRILRYFRFLAAFGSGRPDADGLAACIRGRDGVAGLSAERLRAELLKLLAVDDCLAAVEAFAHTGILVDILGGVVRPGTLAQLAEIERQLARDPDPLLRLCVLAIRTREDAARIADRLKLSNDERTRLATALDEAGHLSPALEKAGWKELLYRLGEATFHDRVLCNWARSGAGLDEAWRDLYEFPDQWTAPVNPFRGQDVLARGIAAGPDIGHILDRAEALWIEAGFPGEEAFVLKLLDRAIADADPA
jgi:poly(A) polymerase